MALADGSPLSHPSPSSSRRAASAEADQPADDPRVVAATQTRPHPRMVRCSTGRRLTHVAPDVGRRAADRLGPCFIGRARLDVDAMSTPMASHAAQLGGPRPQPSNNERGPRPRFRWSGAARVKMLLSQGNARPKGFEPLTF